VWPVELLDCHFIYRPNGDTAVCMLHPEVVDNETELFLQISRSERTSREANNEHHVHVHSQFQNTHCSSLVLLNYVYGTPQKKNKY